MKTPVAEDFRAESEALYALIKPLAEAEFDRKTAFKGWTINNILRHLHVWNYAAELSLRDGKAFLPERSGRLGWTRHERAIVNYRPFNGKLGPWPSGL